MLVYVHRVILVIVGVSTHPACDCTQCVCCVSHKNVTSFVNEQTSEKVDN